MINKYSKYCLFNFVSFSFFFSFFFWVCFPLSLKHRYKSDCVIICILSFFFCINCHNKFGLQHHKYSKIKSIFNLSLKMDMSNIYALLTKCFCTLENKWPKEGGIEVFCLMYWNKFRAVTRLIQIKLTHNSVFIGKQYVSLF